MERHRILFRYAGPEDDAAITLVRTHKSASIWCQCFSFHCVLKMARQEVLTGLVLVLVLVFLSNWKKYFGQRKNLSENVLNFGISLIYATKWSLPSAFSKFDNFVQCEYQEMLQSELLLRTEFTKKYSEGFLFVWAIEPKQIMFHIYLGVCILFLSK